MRATSSSIACRRRSAAEFSGSSLKSTVPGSRPLAPRTETRRQAAFRSTIACAAALDFATGRALIPRRTAARRRPMPLHFCHPNTPHKKLKMPEWYVSSLMMDRALDAVVRRAKKLDRKHDIPYLAGYSIDGKTIYIDRHMPKSMHYAGREIDTDRYLILHEEVEKTLIDQLGLHYLH